MAVFDLRVAALSIDLMIGPNSFSSALEGETTTAGVGVAAVFAVPHSTGGSAEDVCA